LFPRNLERKFRAVIAQADLLFMWIAHRLTNHYHPAALAMSSWDRAKRISRLEIPMKNESTPYLKRCLLAMLTLACCAQFGQTAAQTPRTLDQGSKWNNTTRTQFYSQDQGSRTIPLKWARALKQPNGEPFLAANLDRYGYLPNPASPAGLPI